MKEKIYVQLLGEGTRVYRPVQAVRLDKNIYKLLNEDYDPDIEDWEFNPDSIVVVEEKILEGELVLVATKKFFVK